MHSGMLSFRHAFPIPHLAGVGDLGQAGVGGGPSLQECVVGFTGSCRVAAEFLYASEAVEADYGALKAACEAVVADVYGERGTMSLEKGNVRLVRSPGAAATHPATTARKASPTATPANRSG